MTEQQIREAVEGLRATPKDKAALLKQALAGDASALFVLGAAWRRQNG